MKKLTLILIAFACFINIAAAQQDSCNISKKGLVAWYPLDGNASDFSGNSFNGTVNGATTTNNRFGTTGKAFQFGSNPSSTQQNIEVLNFAAITDYTITGWINYGGYEAEIFTNNYSSNGSFGLSIDVNGYLTVTNYDGTNVGYCTSTLPISSGWIFVAASFNHLNHLVKLYKNADTISGGYTGSYPMPSLHTSSVPFYIGYAYTDGWNSYISDIDDIRIYNRVLTDAEIEAIHKEGILPPVANNQTACAGGTIPNLQATGSYITWYGDSLSMLTHNPVCTFPSYNTMQTTPGVYTYYVTQTINSVQSCPTLVTLTIYTTPAKPSKPAGPTALCINSANTTYTASAANATGYIWAVTGAGDTISGTGTTGTVNWSNTFSGTAKIYVKGTNGGCTGIASDTLYVTIKPLPGTPTTPTSTSPDTLCENPANTTYTSSAANATSYIWVVTGTGNTMSGTGTTGTVNWSNTFTGTATITAQGVNSCGTGAISNPITVVVNHYPATPATPTGQTTLCQNSIPTSYSTSVATYATSYKWNIYPPSAADSITGTGTNATVTWNPSFTGTAYIKVKGTNGCDGPYSDSLKVTVNPAPPAVITPATVTPFCQGSSVTLHANTGSGLSYQWYNQSGNIGTSQTYTATQTGAYTVVVTNSNGCSATSNTVTVTVNPLPGTIGVISGPVTVCQGETSVTYSVPLNANVNTYYWTVPNGNIVSGSGTHQIMVNFLPNAVPDYISVYGTNSCGSSNTAKVHVTVKPLPVAAGSISGKTSVCQGDNETYTVPVITHATKYNWTLPYGATGNSSTNSITVHFGASGSGNITVNGLSACGNGTSSTLPITINPTPSTPAINCNGNSVLHSSATSGNLWYLAGLSTGVTSQDITPNVPGRYYVIVKLNGCSSAQSNTIIWTPTSCTPGIEEYTSENGMSIYPNPAYTMINIEFDESAKSDKGEITIYDVLGKLLIQQTLNDKKTEINITNLAKGIYVLKAKNDKGTIVRKIIKE